MSAGKNERNWVIDISYLNIGSLPKKVTNVMNEIAKTTNAIFEMTPILKMRARDCRPSTAVPMHPKLPT